MRYAVVIEKADGNYSAYVPDLPGCVATGATIAEVEAEIHDAIVFHLEGMRKDGIVLPAPSSQVEYIEVAA
jgi:predicted RNase H-like HicB family nuclease